MKSPDPFEYLIHVYVYIYIYSIYIIMCYYIIFYTIPYNTHNETYKAALNVARLVCNSLRRVIFFGICFCRCGHVFFDFWFPAFLLLCFLFFCFSLLFSFMVLCFFASPLFCFFASLLLHSDSLLLCFAFPASLLLCFLLLPAFLLLCFSLFFSHTADNP